MYTLFKSERVTTEEEISSMESDRVLLRSDDSFEEVSVVRPASCTRFTNRLVSKQTFGARPIYGGQLARAPLMDYFSRSHHNRHCIYTREKVAELRHAVNQEAVAGIKALLPADLEPPTAAEESALLQFYRLKIPELCRYFKFPPSVAATAHWLLTRLTLRHSWLTHDPKHTMLCCVWLATKCENLHLGMSDFAGKIPNTNVEWLGEMEFVLLAALEYQINFFAPATPLAGLLLDYKIGGTGDFSAEMPMEAGKMLDRICATDALLLYKPATLAGCALKMACDSPSMDAYLQEKCPSSLEELPRIKELLENASRIDAEQVKAIDRRLIQIRKHVS
ncbi:hypothetical protein PSACC_02055 [Paramicrosporidium saccamoebae]|uniref:Cyclin N-terminal domain-containing protein n=1 Tax=Paramicrosporidium saccamoebae TaxID=1246581 RepID=A0A2H9TK40_9FUNG|nr:hypothetical protein PSACC_02055 [Paramicrosporidium saccamoebae]